MSTIASWLAGRDADARRDVEVLISYLTGRSRAWLYAHGDEALAADVAARLSQLLVRRRAGEPIAYLIGHREFFGLDLEASAAALVPRPETELLVELALEQLPPAARVLDLGTGSGAIAVAIATQRPDCIVSASDIDIAALDLAERNAARHRARIEFRASDWFEGWAERRFDLVVANPPYVAAQDPHLDALGFEPSIALVSGPEGLDALTAIVAGAAAHLARGGRLILEHGAEQGERVRALLGRAGFRDVATRRDLAGRERATLGRDER